MEKAEGCFDLFASPSRPAAVKKKRMAIGGTAAFEGEKDWRSLISDKHSSNPVDKFALCMSCIDFPQLHFFVEK